MKPRTTRSVRSIALISVIAACCAPTAYAQTETPNLTVPAGSMNTPMSGMYGMKKPITDSMDGMQNMQMSGDQDKDFATMMRMHNQKGVEMAQMELDQGKSPEMKKMARNIIVAKKREIADFDKWLARQK